MQKETLVFKRMATKAKDDKNGVLYIHYFENGYQELIFDSHEAAKKFKDFLNTPEYFEYLKRPA